MWIRVLIIIVASMAVLPRLLAFIKTGECASWDIGTIRLLATVVIGGVAYELGSAFLKKFKP